LILFLVPVLSDGYSDEGESGNKFNFEESHHDDERKEDSVGSRF
jgi:hypothetical protein